MKTTNAILRNSGSMWFAAILLILLAFAMACATVFEAVNGPERALATFYHSWWFEGLMILLTINVLAALIIRFPFSAKQAGIFVAHTSIFIILLGALVTKHFGTDGRIGLAAGESATQFSDNNTDTLTITDVAAQRKVILDLVQSAFRGYHAVDNPRAPRLNLGGLTADIQRYLPDSIESREVVNDNPEPALAVEARLTAAERDHDLWIFANRPRSIGPIQIACRLVTNVAELENLLSRPAALPPRGKGTARIEFRGQTFEIRVAETPGNPAPLGDTGYTARVTRYLPHASVDDKNQLVSISDQSTNPAIEVAIIGPQGSATRYAFALFPEFESMHGRDQLEDLKVFFEASSTRPADPPVEILIGPESRLHMRFTNAEGEVTSHEVSPGQPVDTPWEPMRLAVLRHFENARVIQAVVMPDTIGEERIQAILLSLADGQDTQKLWARKHQIQTATLSGREYEVSYTSRRVPLGFKLTLDRFHIGRYPGEQAPRTFQSHIELTNADTGRAQDGIISMNHPVNYGGFTFFQSSYDEESGRMYSFISVSRDPGKPIVFGGYAAMMIGTLMIVVTRIRDRRRAIAADTDRRVEP